MAILTDQATANGLASIPEQFPGVTKWRISTSPPAGCCRGVRARAVDQYFDSLMYDGGDKAEMFKVVESRGGGSPRSSARSPTRLRSRKTSRKGSTSLPPPIRGRRGQGRPLRRPRAPEQYLYLAAPGPALRHRGRGRPQPGRPHRCRRSDRRIRRTNADGDGVIREFSSRPRTDIDTLATACAARDILLLWMRCSRSA